MEKNNLDQNPIFFNKIKNFWENKEAITIVGINGVGEPFETSGQIATDDKNNIGVYDEAIFLYFGQLNNEKFIAPFPSSCEDKCFWNVNFFIKEVKDKDGNVLFDNPNFEELKMISENSRKETENRLIADGRLIEEDDNVLKSLRNMIGKPIIIYDNEDYNGGVLVNIKGSANNGSACIDVRVATLVGGLHVNYDSCLATLDKNGQMVTIADNNIDKNNTLRIFKDRKNKILDAKYRNSENE